MKRFMRSAAYAWAGLCFAFRTQRNMKYHAAAAVLACGLSALMGLNRIEWAIILMMIALVIALEAVNTAIEKAVDLASPNVHPLAKTAKDAAAGAVLLAAAASIIIGLLILGPPLWHLIRSKI